MAPRRSGTVRSRSSKFRLPVFCLLFLSLVAPLIFLAARLGNFASFDHKDFLEGSIKSRIDDTKLTALHQIENLFPKEIIEIIKSNTDDTGPLSLNVARRKDLSSSWIVENAAESDNTRTESKKEGLDEIGMGGVKVSVSGYRRGALDLRDTLGMTDLGPMKLDDKETKPTLVDGGKNKTDSESAEAAAERIARQKTRIERQLKRATDFRQLDEEERLKQAKEAIESRKDVNGSVFNKYSVWRRDNEDEPDYMVKLMRDQIIMARVYASLAHSQNDEDLQRELNSYVKDIWRVLGEANLDVELPYSASDKIKAMGQILSKAKERLYDCKSVSKKLRAMLQFSEEHAHALSSQATVLRQLVAKALPKGLHCLSLLLASEYNALPDSKRELAGQENLEDTSLFHYALFSDNVLATAVVVNSTVTNVKAPTKHVFHIVTDKLNYAAMKMWFLANPPGKASIDVQNIDDFKWLNASYCPVLRQLQTAAMKEYYFKTDQPTTLAVAASNMKYRNPKYLSMLNHLRFYLPEVYPKLDKVLFLDDDIVVQRDLTPLWDVDLHGKVNGAVETCGQSFHRFDKYLNFSNPLISNNFDRNACGWAYGMNIFDLKEWKKQDITGIYHKWQNLNERRELWKLGTLPPGLITFYDLTYPLDKRWHVLGLGYEPNVEIDDIQGAAVVHYNGNMKPWLELSMSKYKPYWIKYVNYNSYFLQQCNV